MNPWVGWGLALVGVVAGYVNYGWQGVVFAVTAIVFWLMVQFSRLLRVLRTASRNPVGQIPNAVMFNAWLRSGMRLTDVLKVTRSIGRRVGDGEDPEVWAWGDAAGDEVLVELVNGRVTRWKLQRAEPPGGSPADSSADSSAGAPAA